MIYEWWRDFIYKCKKKRHFFRAMFCKHYRKHHRCQIHLENGQDGLRCMMCDCPKERSR